MLETTPMWPLRLAWTTSGTGQRCLEDEFSRPHGRRAGARVAGREAESWSLASMGRSEVVTLKRVYSRALKVACSKAFIQIYNMHTSGASRSAVPSCVD